MTDPVSLCHGAPIRLARWSQQRVCTRCGDLCGESQASSYVDSFEGSSDDVRQLADGPDDNHEDHARYCDVKL